MQNTINAEYRTAWGTRLIVQSGRKPAAAPRVINRKQADLEDRIEEARRQGRCSVCDAPVPTSSLDAAARCKECQS